MKSKLPATLVLLVGVLAACSDNKPGNTTAASPRPATPAPSPSVATKDGDYNAKGVVTRINTELGSVEMDHEDIPGLMPPMRMEFYVTDKKMLEGLKAGDRVEFVLRYKNRNETIVKLAKAK